MTDTWDTFEQATQVAAKISKHRFSDIEWAEQFSVSDGRLFSRAISKTHRLLARHLDKVKTPSEWPIGLC